MQRDVFISSKSSINKQVDAQEDSNFFMQPEKLVINSEIKNKSGSLNDYDMNILEKDAYKEIGNETLKLEYKINKLEKEIAELDDRIEAADVIGDAITSEKLKNRKIQLETDLFELNSIYKEISISAKIIDGISSPIMKKIGLFGTVINNIYNHIVSLLPPRIFSLITLKKSLEKLESINKSVDELISMQTPYGEAIDRYNQLSRYIIKANNIQSEISKHIK